MIVPTDTSNPRRLERDLFELRRRHPRDFDIGCEALKVLAAFGSADGLVVLRATVRAGDPDGLSGDCTKGFQCVN